MSELMNSLNELMHEINNHKTVITDAINYSDDIINMMADKEAVMSRYEKSIITF
jgi:hypothetical protein